MTERIALQGVVVPLTTPFDEKGEVMPRAFAEQVQWMIDSGAQGLVVGGSTGEGYALAHDELEQLCRIALTTAAGRVPVLVSIMADSTREAMQGVQRLAPLDLWGLQVAPPHYIFTPGDDEMVAFYRDVARAAERPLIVYNVIHWAAVKPSLAARIMTEVPQVTAIKQSDKDLGTFQELLLAVGPERVFGAIDGSLMSCYDLGVAGSIAAIASAAPRANCALWQALKVGNRKRATRINRQLGLLWQSLAGQDLPARVKAAQHAQGLEAGYPRAPMAPVDAAVSGAISDSLHALDKLLDESC